MPLYLLIIIKKKMKWQQLEAYVSFKKHPTEIGAKFHVGPGLFSVKQPILLIYGKWLGNNI